MCHDRVQFRASILKKREVRLTPNIISQFLLYYALPVMYIQVHCSIINNQHINGSFIKSNSIRWLVRAHWHVRDNLSTLIKTVHWYGQDNDPSQKFKTSDARIDKHWSLIRIIKPDEIPLSRIPLQIISVLPHNNLNLLKPSGHVMHHQFNIQQLYALPTLCLYVLYLSENKQRLVPLTA